MAKPRKDLISAMAYAVDTLVTQALADTKVTICTLLECDDRIWDELSDSTVEILEEGLGITRPAARAAKGSE